jgi:hypothetical protein
MTTFVNTDVHRRVWTGLVNEETGSTLELEPGEECELSLASADEDFDPYLKPVGKPSKAKAKAKAQKEDEKEPVDPVDESKPDEPDDAGEENA